MNSFELKIDPRESQYARLAGQVLRTIRSAVDRRVNEGVSQNEIARRISMDKGSLSRVLNGRISNLTLRTISDILWATEHDPVEFSADAIEDISPNYCPVHMRAADRAVVLGSAPSPKVTGTAHMRVATQSFALEPA